MTRRPRRPRHLLAVLSLATLLSACATPPPSGPATGQRFPGTSDRTGSGAMCVGDSQPCSNDARCCSGMSCQPAGRLGMLCRYPFPGV